jgi:hypothetical protein
MKASETIKKLSELVAKYGDGEVRVTHQSELASVWAVTGMDARLAYYLFSAGDTKIGWPSTIQRASAPGMGEFSSKGVTD